MRSASMQEVAQFYLHHSRTFTIKTSYVKIFTWHIHGSYLYYLSQGNFTIYIPVNKEKSEGYGGRGATFNFGENVIEVDAADVWRLELDCILFQSSNNYLVDQYDVLSESQRKLPRIFLEHDPPRNQPTDTRHVVEDPEVLTVHVTYFNQLMWQNEGPTTVIEHGVTVPLSMKYSGEIEKGLVVVNNLHKRGRRLGADIFDKVKKEVPLDLVGMGTKEFGGLGEVKYHDLPGFASRYRFFFNPIRYTSLGLAFLEAMMLGMPVVCLATTEYATVIHDKENGFTHTRVDYLVQKMKQLISDPQLAMSLGQQGKETVDKRFNIGRFCEDWQKVFDSIIYKSR